MNEDYCSMVPPPASIADFDETETSPPAVGASVQVKPSLPIWRARRLAWMEFSAFEVTPPLGKNLHDLS